MWMTVLQKHNMFVVTNSGEQVNGPHSASFRDIRGKIAVFSCKKPTPSKSVTSTSTMDFVPW